MTDWRLDRPAPGLRIAQPVPGFKYTSDAFWLAGFAVEPGIPETALDLGTGSGIVAFLLASLGVHVTAVDAHAAWEEGWRRSLAESRVPGSVTFVRASVVDRLPVGCFPLVTCNPPYWPVGAGPTPKDALTLAGRVEGEGTLGHFVDAGLRHLAPGGTFALVLPAARAGALRPAVRVDTGDRALVRFGGASSPATIADAGRTGSWYDRFGAPRPR